MKMTECEQKITNYNAATAKFRLDIQDAFEKHSSDQERSVSDCDAQSAKPCEERVVIMML